MRPGSQVWVAREGTLVVVPIDVAHTTSGFVLVRQQPAGLRPDDLLITSPLAAVQDGMLIRDAATDTRHNP